MEGAINIVPVKFTLNGKSTRVAMRRPPTLIPVARTAAGAHGRVNKRSNAHSYKNIRIAGLVSKRY